MLFNGMIWGKGGAECHSDGGGGELWEGLAGMGVATGWAHSL